MQAYPPIDAPLAYFNNLSQRSGQTLQALNALNLRLAQQLIEDAAQSGQQFMACATPWQVAITAVKQLQPVSEHLRHYQQELVEVLTGSQFIH